MSFYLIIYIFINKETLILLKRKKKNRLFKYLILKISHFGKIEVVATTQNRFQKIPLKVFIKRVNKTD